MTAPETPEEIDPPLSWRLVLVDLFREAEEHGLGRLQVGFTAATGREEDAARYIERRCGWLADHRFGGGG